MFRGRILKDSSVDVANVETAWFPALLQDKGENLQEQTQQEFTKSSDSNLPYNIQELMGPIRGEKKSNLQEEGVGSSLCRGCEY